jgi:hypothetical protein
VKIKHQVFVFDAARHPFCLCWVNAR